MFRQHVLWEIRKEERLVWCKGCILVPLPCYLVHSVWFSILVQENIEIKVEVSVESRSVSKAPKSRTRISTQVPKQMTRERSEEMQKLVLKHYTVALGPEWAFGPVAREEHSSRSWILTKYEVQLLFNLDQTQCLPYICLVSLFL